MQQTDFNRAVQRICNDKARFDKEAYFFIREALDFTVTKRKKSGQGKGRHVSAEELLNGLRKLALQEFGPMAITVFRKWGVISTADIGEIVFDLVESGLLGKTDEDSKEDFENVFDFSLEFEKPFLPPKKYNRKSSRITKRINSKG